MAHSTKSSAVPQAFASCCDESSGSPIPAHSTVFASISIKIWQSVRSGKWLTPPRTRTYSLIILGVYGLAILGWIGSAHGLIDRNGKPIGTDFSSFYAAGSLALTGHASDAYNMDEHHAREQAIFGPDTPYYSWNYPPIFFLLVAPLASLPYWLALTFFQGTTLALYLGVMAAILRPVRQRRGAAASTWLPIAAAYPAVFINMGHGQNGFLTAGILGGALMILPSRPLFAGLLMGLLAYKPQFATMIPVALLAGLQWRALSTMAFTTVVLATASCVIFGADCWVAFVGSAEISRKLLLEQGAVGFEKIQSAFAAIRLWGGGMTLSYVVQSAVSAVAACGTAWAWRYSESPHIKSAVLLASTALASPYLLDYDLVLLGPAIAFLVDEIDAERPRAYEVSLLVFVWIAPLFTRTVAGLSSIPLGLLATLTIFALIVRRTNWCNRPKGDTHDSTGDG
jgi:glycosyl transferase family 87